MAKKDEDDTIVGGGLVIPIRPSRTRNPLDLYEFQAQESWCESEAEEVQPESGTRPTMKPERST